MIRSVTGIHDPREGEQPDPADWCHEHGLAKDSCGPCHQREIDDEATVGFEALAEAFAQVLDRASQTEDETKGAALAARFDKEQ